MSDLYSRLESLSKALESNGVIYEDVHRGAYSTILDAMNAVRAHPDRSQREIDILRAERDHARHCLHNAVQKLVSIHSLMYPPPLK
jgi:hypothetical protein